MGITTCCLLLNGCSDNQHNKKEAKEEKLSQATITSSFDKANQAIEDHQYKKAFTNLDKIEKGAKNQEDKDKAKKLTKQLKSYNKAYQESLNATDGKSSKKAAKALLNVIKMDQKSSVAQEAIQSLSKYQKAADLYPGNLTIPYNRMVIAKRDEIKKYDKAEMSSKSKKIKEDEAFRAQDICYIDGKAYYALYLDDKKHNNTLKRVGYAKASDFTTIEGIPMNKIKTVKKSSNSHIQFFGGDKKKSLKKGQKYYVTYKYEWKGKTIYSLNEVKDGKPKKDKEDRYIWAGYAESKIFK